MTNYEVFCKASFDVTDDMIVIALDMEYKYVFFNHNHENEMKKAYNVDVSVGHCIFDYIEEDEVQSLKKNYDLALSGTKHTVVEEYGELETNYYSITFTPVYKQDTTIIGLIVSAKNITTTKMMEQKLEIQKEIARTYFEVTNQLLIVLDTNATIVLVNEAGCRILEDTKDNIIGKNWFQQFIPTTINDEVMQVFKTVFETGKNNANTYINDVLTATGKIKKIKWNNSLIRDINGKVENVLSYGEDITEQLEYENTLLQLARTDELTGLYNRRYYEIQLSKLDNPDTIPLSIIIMDINGLKLMNDAFGHMSGDKLIKETARIISDVSPENALVFRIGGDEFAMILPQTKKKLAQKLIYQINDEAAKVDIQGIKLSIASGMDTKLTNDDNLQQIVRSAEDMMYRMKLLEIPSMRSSTIDAILTALNEKDPYSKEHSSNVAIYSERFAKTLGLSANNSKLLHSIGLLHDIGKIVIPNSIINKRSLLTKSEYHEVKKHSEIGFRILNSSKNLRDVSTIVLYHHEWWDGSGYPSGLKGKEIPYYSRIMAITDSFDAMTSDRLYRNRLTIEEACDEILRCSGTQFDPTLAQSFIDNIAIITKETKS